MTTVLKEKHQLVVPESVRRRARLKAGDEVEFRANSGVITIITKPPAADDEYTPEQRRIIDARIAEGLEDFKKGRVHGPFATAKEASACIERLAKKRAAPGERPKRSPR